MWVRRCMEAIGYDAPDLRFMGGCENEVADETVWTKIIATDLGSQLM